MRDFLSHPSKIPPSARGAPPTFFYVNKYLESWNRFSSLWRLDKQVFIEKLATKALSWLEYDRRFEVSPLADGGEGVRTDPNTPPSLLLGNPAIGF